jgi:predicted  nucleic acid-binding Zn-ribbon protein
MESLQQLLFQIEIIERRLPGARGGKAEAALADLTLLLCQLPKPVRDQYEWLRNWTWYPIARLRSRACTGCGATYPDDHSFVTTNEGKVTFCEHCLRILILKDLALVA